MTIDLQSEIRRKPNCKDAIRKEFLSLSIPTLVQSSSAQFFKLGEI